MFTTLVTDERTDGRTNRQVENIMPMLASLAWRIVTVDYVRETTHCTGSL